MNMNTVWQFGKRFPGMFVSLFVLFWVSFAHPYNNGPDIRSDGVGYHMWTHALMTGDFSFCKYKAVPTFDLSISNINLEKKICQNKYPLGVALARLPLMIFATKNTSHLKISKGEHNISRLSGALCLLGVFFVMVMVLRSLGLNDRSTDIAILLGTFGTGLFHYATYDNSFSHIYSSLGVALLLWVGVKIIQSKITSSILALFVVNSFWLVMLRNTNIFILGFWGVATLLQSKNKIHSLIILGTGSLGAIAAICLQLSYNYYATGQFSLSSYGQEPFVWERPMFASVLFSYERGLFSYYPVMLLGFLGLCFREVRPWAVMYVVLVLFTAALYGYWHSWFLGGGFGHRGFVELSPFFMLTIGLVLNTSSEFLRPYLLGIAFLSAGATVIFMSGYWQGSLPFGGTNSVIYWQHLRPLFLLLPLLCLIFSIKNFLGSKDPEIEDCNPSHKIL